MLTHSHYAAGRSHGLHLDLLFEALAVRGNVSVVRVHRRGYGPINLRLLHSVLPSCRPKRRDAEKAVARKFWSCVPMTSRAHSINPTLQLTGREGGISGLMALGVA